MKDIIKAALFVLGLAGLIGLGLYVVKSVKVHQDKDVIEEVRDVEDEILEAREKVADEYEDVRQAVESAWEDRK